VLRKVVLYVTLRSISAWVHAKPSLDEDALKEIYWKISSSTNSKQLSARRVSRKRMQEKNVSKQRCEQMTPGNAHAKSLSIRRSVTCILEGTERKDGEGKTLELRRKTLLSWRSDLDNEGCTLAAR